MHDPQVVIWSCRWFTLWHVDPEEDGSDDSCGWSYPRLTDRQRETLKGLSHTEAYEPWFQRLRAKRIEDHVEAEHLMRGAVQLVARVLDLDATWDEVCRWSCRFIHNPMDNFRGGLCHLSGYHTNFEEDTRRGREETAYGLFSGIAHHMLRDRRPWWKHLRFHVHHWRLQVRPYQSFFRWAFTRCSACGGRFRWGETGVGTWSGAGPRWFRSEELTHMDCQGKPSGSEVRSDGNAAAG